VFSKLDMRQGYHQLLLDPESRKIATFSTPWGNMRKPNPDKIRALKESSQPKSKEAVRSFLGMTGYLSKFIPRYASLTAPLRKLAHKVIKFKWGAEENEAFENLKASITSECKMAYFNPARPIVVRVEASFHEGLSAGLFQETGCDLQPVHFISRTMTDTEKRYSQTEKDALSVHWAKNRFSICLLGADYHCPQATAPTV